jgi:hypothetical protein
MASDIFYALSRPELKKEIEALVALDQRSLPPRAKVFAAVAKKQQFDLLPDSATPEAIDKICTDGAVELNRGISTSNGLPAIHYARELLSGPLYPGTQSAMGNGIHLAEPSIDHGVAGFSKISTIAREYASTNKPGMIVRCALKKNTQNIDFDELRTFFRENRNRAHDVGITDAGAFAAALGFEAIFCEHVYDHTNERCWIVLNRGALIFQRTGLQLAE